MRRAMVIGAGVLGGLLAPLATPAGAQWKVHLAGRDEPLEAAFYAEETPWVFFRFRDDRSMYLFTLGCDRVIRVERDGADLPRLNCPLPRLATTMPRVYAGIIEKEAKLLEDVLAKLSKDVDALRTINAGASGGTAESPAERERQQQAAKRAADVVTQRIAQSFKEIDDIDRRIGALMEASKGLVANVDYPPEKPRYFFFRR